MASRESTMKICQRAASGLSERIALDYHLTIPMAGCNVFRELA
jgi:hypothetical protein